MNTLKMANRLKELRKRAKLTQQQLADAASTSPQEISRLERGERKLPPEWMARLAPALGVRPAALMDSQVESIPHPKSNSKLVDDPDELALLALWGAVSKEQKVAILTLIGANAAALRSLDGRKIKNSAHPASRAKERK